MIPNSEKILILRIFAASQAFEQAFHWAIAAGLDFYDEFTIKSVMTMFYDNEHLEEKLMWIRAYALIIIINEEGKDQSELMKAFTDLMRTSKKFKYFPSVAFRDGLKKEFLRLLPNDPRIRFFTLINNKMLKEAFEDIEMISSGDEDWEQFVYLRDSFQKYIVSKIDSTREKVFVNFVEQKPIQRKNPISNNSSLVFPKKLF